jgi:uncharacterized protein
MNEEKLRVVFDCMVFLQALISDKSIAFQLFEYLEQNAFTLYVSYETLEEVRDVLSHPYIILKNPNFTDDFVKKFLNRVIEKSILLNKMSSHFSYLRDPKDEKYINLAVEAKADYIVSRDKDLLDLMKGYDADSKEFRQRFRPLKVIEPIEFLKVLQKNDLLQTQ